MSQPPSLHDYGTRAKPPDSRPISPVVVALTGCHGAIGRTLLPRLVRLPEIARVLCLDIEPPALAEGSDVASKLAYVNVDLTAADATSTVASALKSHQVATLVHLAFRQGPSPYPGRSHELESVGSMRLAQACLESKVRKILLWSRTWLYGARADAPSVLDEQAPTNARRTERFLADKIDAERDILSFRAPGRGRTATILRMAPIVCPGSSSHITNLLMSRSVPSILGFDPMVQLLHVDDAAEAILLALFRDGPPIVNVTSAGAVPLSYARRTLGTRPLVLPRSMATAMTSALWLSGKGQLPPSMLDYIQYSCVADDRLAGSVLSYHASHNASSILEQARADAQRSAK